MANRSKFPAILEFNDVLFEIVAGLDSIMFSLCYATDKIDKHNRFKLHRTTCANAYCTDKPPLNTPHTHPHPVNIPKSCRHGITYVDHHLMTNLINQMRIYDQIDIEKVKNEILTLTGNDPSTNSLPFADLEENDYILMEIRSLVNHCHTFQLNTYTHQRSQLLNIKLIFSSLSFFQPEAYMADIFINMLENFNLLDKFFTVSYYINRNGIANDFDITTYPTVGRVLSLYRIKTLVTFLIRSPDYTQID